MKKKGSKREGKARRVVAVGDELARGLGRYTAVYERDGAEWMVEIREVPHCHTSGDSLSRARAKIRKALALWVDDAARAEIVDDVRLPVDVKAVIARYRAARAKAEAAQTTASEASRAAVRRLVGDLGLSTRDAAELAGISQQRVAQIG